MCHLLIIGCNMLNYINFRIRLLQEVIKRVTTPTRCENLEGLRIIYYWLKKTHFKYLLHFLINRFRWPFLFPPFKIELSKRGLS
jgi:hypothetical protein